MAQMVLGGIGAAVGGGLGQAIGAALGGRRCRRRGSGGRGWSR